MRVDLSENTLCIMRPFAVRILCKTAEHLVRRRLPIIPHNFLYFVYQRQHHFRKILCLALFDNRVQSHFKCFSFCDMCETLCHIDSPFLQSSLTTLLFQLFQWHVFYVGNITRDISRITTKAPYETTLMHERHACIEISAFVTRFIRAYFEVQAYSTLYYSQFLCVHA